MPGYAFHAFSDGRARGVLTTRVLVDDIEANVRSFDLLRDNANLTSIEVYREGVKVLTRTRVAAKSVVAWEPGIARSIRRRPGDREIRKVATQGRIPGPKPAPVLA